MIRQTARVAGVALSLIAAMGTLRAAYRSDAVLLVNSQSAAYSDAERKIRPYLDNFGVPYSILDVATTPVGSSIADYALIIIGHRKLDTSHQYLDAVEEQNISIAVQNGTGLVNFDNDLSPDGSTPRYQFVQEIFGFQYISAPTGNGVVFTPESSTHYITARHDASEYIATDAMKTAGLLLPVGATALALVDSAPEPLVTIAICGEGRAVQWGSYDWTTLATKGPVYGLDDLFWRSLVWAARKPLVMQGLPPFVTMRVDDSEGPLWWVHTGSEFALKPWLGVFYKSMTNRDADELSTLVNSGTATASVHAKSTNTWFYFDHNGQRNFSDTQVSANFDDATSWHNTHNIPISDFVVGHYYELGSNVFGRLQSWGVEFVGTMEEPGKPYAGSPWLKLLPYRVFETAQRADSSRPVAYTDYLKIPGHPELDKKFFNCVTEIRDDAGYEWYPDNNVPATIGRGTRQTKRALDSLVLPTLFTHEYYIQSIDPDNWRSILSGITANLQSYDPSYVTLDYACRYVRATYTSQIASSDYDPATRIASTRFTGSADIPTKFYLFSENGGNVTETFVDVPAFSGSATVDYQLAGPLHHIVVSPDLGRVATGGTLQYHAQGYDAQNRPIPGLSYAWSASAGGTIDSMGLFTAGDLADLFTDNIAASSGGITGYATTEVYTPSLDHFAFDTIAGPVYAGTAFSIRLTAHDQSGNVLTTFADRAALADTTDSVSPRETGDFAGGVWTGEVVLDRTQTAVTLSASSGAAAGASNGFDVLQPRTGPITINCWDDLHQEPVLRTTTNVTDVNDSDGKWTEFLYTPSRPYPTLLAGVNEENYGLPLLRFYDSGIKEGTYEFWAKLYTNDTGRDMRYYYGFRPDAPKAYYVDTVGGTGGTEQHTEYRLTDVTVSGGAFDLYVRDADLLAGTYPFFGWASIRLTCIAASWYRDADGDGYGDPAVSQTACSAPVGYVWNAKDCDDGDSSVRPGTPETDCDGVDDDCDGSTDEGYVSVTTVCGAGACASEGSTLCAAGQVANSCTPGPVSAEICNGVDDDCDGAVDDGVQTSWYRDFDVDGYGDAAQMSLSCGQPSGFVGNSEDCDDFDGAVHHAPSEVRAVMVERPGTAVRVSWESQAAFAGSATVYDLVTGLISELGADAGYERASCLAAAWSATMFEDSRTVPPPDDISYYLVRARNSCGTASYGDSNVSPDCRDPLDANDPCP